MNQSERLDVLATVADEQRGFFTTAQAESAGVSRVEVARLASREQLERVERGVYRMRGSGFEGHSALRGAWLALHGKAEPITRGASAIVVSHASAAALHGIGDLLADEAEFTVSRRLQTIRDGIRVHRAELSDDDIEIVEGLPTTTIVRTIADLVADGHDGEHVGTAVGDAVRRGAVSMSALSAALAPYAARRGFSSGDGAALLDDLLRVAGLDRATLITSLAQSQWARELLSAGALAGAQAVIADVIRNSAIVEAVEANAFEGIEWPVPDFAELVGTRLFDAISEQLKVTLTDAAQPLLDAIVRDTSWLQATDLLQVSQAIGQLDMLESPKVGSPA